MKLALFFAAFIAGLALAASANAYADPTQRPKPKPPVLCIYTAGQTQCWMVVTK